MSSNMGIQEINREKDILYIQTFGEFTLRYKDNVLSGDKVRSKQVWALLEYLICNRTSDNSQDKLIESLWEDAEIDDPANALKNLAYRLRTTFKDKLGLDGSKYIVSKHGSYAWNLDSEYIVDMDIFEENLKSAEPGYMADKELLNKYITAVDLYKGNFMPQSDYKEWIRPQAVYLQNLYMDAVKKASALLIKEYNYTKAEEINRFALSIDKFSEENNINLMKALIGQKNNKKALEHYEYITKLLFTEYGLKPSENITALYKDITEKNDGYDKNIEITKADLRESEKVTGTMVCSYETFKSIYRLQSRAAIRNGRSVFIMLLTLEPLTSQKYFNNNLEEILKNILDIICDKLRKDDVVARCGRTQFVIMLSNITYENTQIVMDRLNSGFKTSVVNKQVEIHMETAILDPLELEGQNEDH